jgi:hypothetical protein
MLSMTLSRAPPFRRPMLANYHFQRDPYSDQTDQAIQRIQQGTTTTNPVAAVVVVLSITAIPIKVIPKDVLLYWQVEHVQRPMTGLLAEEYRDVGLCCECEASEGTTTTSWERGGTISCGIARHVREGVGGAARRGT